MFRTAILAALSTLLFSGSPLAAAGKLDVSSPAFSEGKPIPKMYTRAGDDVSPPLQWGKVPAGTKSIAVICDDPDAPKKTWVHWVIFNLPRDTKELPKGVEKKKTLSSKAKQGKNDMKKIGYNGPYPPKGKAHHYRFKVYALDKKLPLKAGATKKKLLANMKGHILAEGQLIGTFQR